MRSLEIFVAAYEQRSFTLAAQQVGATQSGVSQHIAKLERLYGVALFQRDGGRVMPTAAADAFYRDCAALLRDRDAAVARLKAFAPGFVGDLHVGIMPTLSARALAPSLVAFRGLNPNVTVRMTEAYSGVLTEKIISGEVDFAVVPSAPGALGVVARSFMSVPEVFVCAHKPGSQRVGVVNLRDMAPLRLVLPSPVNQRAHTIRTFLATHGIDVAASLELDSMMATLDLVAQSDWTAILPVLMMGGAGSGGRFNYRTMEPPLSLDLVTISSAKRSLSPVAEAFLETMRHQCEGLMSRQAIAA